MTDDDYEHQPSHLLERTQDRLKNEGSELATNCSQLKMESADGKNYLTDVADTEQLLRLIESIPSPKAEPFKHWLARALLFGVTIKSC